MKLRKIMPLIISVVFIIGASTPAFASMENTSVSLNTSDYDTVDEMKNSIYALLSNTEIDEVVVFTEEHLGNHFAALNGNNNSEILPCTTSPVYYQVKNVVKKSDVTGTSDLAIATGQPGVTVSIAKTKSVSTTLSATFGQHTALYQQLLDGVLQKVKA